MTTQQPEALRDARWYMVNKMGMATLCTDKEGAEQEAADAQRFWSHMGPHRAVQLVEVNSIAASAGSEPVAWLVCTEEGDPDMVFLSQHEAQQYLEDDERPTPLYTHPSPPEGMVGGWIASKDQMPPPGVRVFWGDVDSNRVGYDSWAGDDYRWAPSHWMHIPEFAAPPTTSAGSRKGE